MKSAVKRLIRDEKGQVLILALILLAVGAIIVSSLLGLMSTGLITGQVYEDKMHELYAADAGVEDALQWLLNNDWDEDNGLIFYYLDDPVNNKRVEVTIDSVWLLEGLPVSLGLPYSQPAEGDPRFGNDHWTVTGAINIENTANYIIDITSNETDAENVMVRHIGVWLPPGYSYVEGSTKINGVAIDEDDLVADPDPTEGIPHKGGTVLIWDFGDETSFGDLSDISPSASGGCTPAEKFPPSVRLSFDYTMAGATPGTPEQTEENGTDYDVYDTAGSATFTPPAGVTSVTVEAWGGGGGGGGRSSGGSGGAGGGGGGAYAKGIVSVTPGQTYTVMVGAGGAGGPGDSPGRDGGDSWFASQSTILAKGGAGGAGGASGAGGAGGTAAASIGSIKYSGGNGAAGTSSYWSSASGGGGGAAGNAADGGDASGATGGTGGSEGGGDGADGRSNNGAGSSGSVPGGGGSGARRSGWSGGPYTGGDGAPGKVIVRYQTAAPEEPGETAIAKGFFSWILLGDERIAWDLEFDVFHITSRAASDFETEAGTTVETYTVISLRRYSPGAGGTASALRGNYIAIGNTLMTSCWKPCHGSACPSCSTHSPSCSVCQGPNCICSCPWDCRNYKVNESSAKVNVDAVPPDARIEKAYLYWSAWWGTNGADKDVTLTVARDGAGGTVPVTASRWYVKEDPSVGYEYACFADVTDEVNNITDEVADTTFTVSGVDAVAAYACNSDYANQSSYAGWSMIIIYSSEQNEARQIYLYDDLAYLWPEPPVKLVYAEFTITGFEAPEGDNEAKLTIFAGEGDDWIQEDSLQFKGQSSSNYEDLYDVSNTKYVFNSMSNTGEFWASQIPGQSLGQISGVDIDTYTSTRPTGGISLSSIVQPGDTVATIKASSTGDGFMLIYVIFSIRSTNVPEGEEFDVGTMTYKIG